MINLADIASGRDTSRILQHCRMSGLGAEFYGTADIAAALREAAVDTTAVTTAQSDATGFLIAQYADGSQAALVAEHVEGWVTRLWLLGDQQSAATPAPHVSVPYDPDRDQRGPGRVIDAADFPEFNRPGDVNGKWEEALAGEQIAALPLTRLRAVTLRAATGSSGRWFALLRIDGTGSAGRGACFAVLHRGGLIVDHAGLARALDQPWSPALRR